MENNLDSDFYNRLIDFIRNTNHEFFTTQTKICYSIIARIHRRVLEGYGTKFGTIKIDQLNKLIVDGNHRYIAYKLANFNFEIIPWNKNFSDPCNTINDFVVITDEDWDMNSEKNRKYCNDNFLKDL
ncbi:hypothetical protein M2T78_07810 [Elizabethkingia ursingii]|uniref:hypothetical protein n=1 Tax=Elizabethkingia ursingii TaxID=1756150 RepID=UPI002013518C|nr:hypothetical protein [Elizabethkingia ursingii]MCL1664150.1 hypothetical protein [Elizabethkingia ursingii]